jgi:hypothetical protein
LDEEDFGKAELINKRKMFLLNGMVILLRHKSVTLNNSNSISFEGKRNRFGKRYTKKAEKRQNFVKNLNKKFKKKIHSFNPLFYVC